jgi:hypothetical protein
MKDENGQDLPISDSRRNNWCESNRDIIEALMNSKELLIKTRELIYQQIKDGELTCGKS